MHSIQTNNKTQMKNLFIIILVLMVSCKNKPNTSTTPKESQSGIKLSNEKITNGNIKWEKPKFGMVPHKINCSGIIDVPPNHKVSLFAPMPGFLKSIKVLPGQEVKKGEVLFTLSHPDYINIQKQYIEFRNQMIFLEKEYERQKILAGENATARKNFEKTESEYLSVKAQVAALEAQLKLLQLPPQKVWEGTISETIIITSPISGYISMFKVNTGQFMAQDQEILSVINREHLHVELQVFEKDISLVKKGQKIDFNISGNDLNYSAFVKLIGEEVDPLSRTINIHGHIEENYPELKTGMFVNASIYAAEDSSFILPETGIVKDGDKTYGFTVENNSDFHRVPVTILHQNMGIISVVLPEGTKNKNWVTQGAYYLNAEMMKDEE